MSLVVWLPLTKDLRQQGLSNITVTNNGATFNSTGKLGGCYEFASGKRIQTTLPASTSLDTKAISFACWMYVISWNSSYDCFMSIADGTGWVQSRATLCRNNTASTLTWNIADGTNRAYVTTTTALSLNTWTHVAGTYDGTNLKIYINGVLNNTSATTLSIGYAGTFNIGGWSGNNYPFNGRLNDVRIYNHCLSPMEVKELARGLVLHYPLNRQGWGQENLLPGSYRADGNTTNKIYGWQANGNGTPEIIKVDNIDCIHLQANCTGKYIPSIVSASKVFLEYGVEYTISCDLKFDKDITVTNSTPIHYHSGSSSSTDEFNTANINNGHGFNFKSISPAAGTTIPANTWQHYEQHIIAKTAPTDSSLPYLTYRAFIYGSVRTISETVSVNMWLKNWKIEKGSIATPWCPNSSDTLATTMGLNSTTEYDCSGFCNNGTRTGTFTWTSDTPKYQVSQVFSGSQYIVEPNEISTTDSTIALWVKSALSANAHVLDARNSSEIGKQPIYQYTNGSIQTGGNNIYVTTNTGLLVANTWVHIVLVQSGNSLLVYKNGVLFQTLSCTNSPIIKPTIGARLNFSNKYTGQLSDLRVYATALSASDVKSLYQNSAYIDSSGNVYGAVHTEV